MNNMKCTIAIFNWKFFLSYFFLKYYILVILFRQIEIVLKDFTAFSTLFVAQTNAVESFKTISINYYLHLQAKLKVLNYFQFLNVQDENRYIVRLF